MNVEILEAKRDTVSAMSEAELLQFAKDEHAECGSNSDYVNDEITKRVRAEIKSQLLSSAAQVPFLQSDSEEVSSAILRGFDESATWHLDAARLGGWQKSISESVGDYLADELDCFLNDLVAKRESLELRTAARN